MGVLSGCHLSVTLNISKNIGQISRFEIIARVGKFLKMVFNLEHFVVITSVKSRDFVQCFLIKAGRLSVKSASNTTF